ncbi:MAG: UvrD-helicase domain-containing protein, partial [Pseudomonadota bacterium]
MSGDLKRGGIPLHDEASLAQIRAADPRHSAWVMANAGSGKTRVLIDRVALLLLGGTPPERILCLTYTKAAAAEMAERLFDRLGRWAMLEDGPLTEALARLHEAPPVLDTAMLGRARRLFAQALETPGGLKIQTIHAFCDALLRRFPLEAGVAPGFFELDARGAAGILAEIRNGLAAAAEAGTDPVFDDLAGLVADTGLETLIEAILKDRGLYPAGIDRAALAAVLDVDPDAGPAACCATALAGMPAQRLRGMATALAAGGVLDQAAAQAIAQALQIGVVAEAAGADPGRAPDAGAVETLAALEAAFLTEKGLPRSERGFPSKAARALRPGLAEDMAALGAAVLSARHARLGAAALDRAEILHRFARALIGAYAAAKARAGALDFEDLIERSRQLLTRSDMRAWVLWKLDGGIDHILVDEAQDTSPAQWQVVAALAEEALAGAGARTLDRTVFAVGDMKQSIYSFQGARPRAFLEMRDRFDRSLTALGSQLRQTPLRHSFRSATPILRLVDACFRGGLSEAVSGGGSDDVAGDVAGGVSEGPYGRPSGGLSDATPL